MALEGTFLEASAKRKEQNGRDTSRLKKTATTSNQGVSSRCALEVSVKYCYSVFALDSIAIGCGRTICSQNHEVV